MQLTSRRRSVGVLTAALLALGTTPTASRAAPDPPESVAATTSADTPVVHRVVWDQHRRGRKGIHLRSAQLDGTDLRQVYDSPRAFVTNLTLDRTGHRVAFAPCCRDDLPTLVIADVLTGDVHEPLADHPKIYFVGGIGWSPDGRRVAFEGSVLGPDSRPNTYLWTVRADGAGLRRVLELEGPGRWHINESLAWTPDGILYSTGRHLRSARAGESRLVLRRVRSVRISGDGEHIVTSRYRGESRSVWIGDPDGTDQHRVLVQGAPGEDPTYDAVTPNYDGTSLLASRWAPDDEGEASIVTWATGEDPALATVVDVTRGNPATSWN